MAETMKKQAEDVAPENVPQHFVGDDGVDDKAKPSEPRVPGTPSYDKDATDSSANFEAAHGLSAGSSAAADVPPSSFGTEQRPFRLNTKRGAVPETVVTEGAAAISATKRQDAAKKDGISGKPSAAAERASAEKPYKAMYGNKLLGYWDH